MILFERPEILPPKQRFIQTVEGLGEVLEAAVRFRKTAIVSEGLDKLKALFDEVQDLRAVDSKKFERLVLSDQVVELAEKDLERAQVELGFNPRRHAVGLHALIDQFLRIHKAAVEAKHDELSRLSVYQLNYVLARATTQKENGFVVEQLVNALSDAARTALGKNDRSVYAAAVHWYTDIVFNRLNKDGKKFELEYLALFNKRLFEQAKLLIRENHAELFEALISSLVDGIMPDLDWGDPFWKAAHFVQEFNPGEYHRRLVGLLSGGLTRDELPATQELIQQMVSAIRPLFKPGEDSSKFEDAVRKLHECIEDRLKFDELMRLVAAIGAYCVFKDAKTSIKTLWEYKQPPDADSSYLGHDIVPDRLDQLLALFYSGKGLSRDYDFHENHRGSELYYEKYLILLLIRLIDLGQEGTLPSSADPIYLHRIADRIDGLKERAAKVAAEPEWQLLFRKPAADLFGRLPAWLDEVKESARHHLDEYVVKSPISSEKVAEFRANFRKEFERENSVRKLLIQHGVYLDLTATENAERTNKQKREYNEVSEKEPFLHQWYSHYADWGSQYGRKFALTESEQVVKALLGGLPSYSPENLGKGPQALEVLLSAIRFLEASGYSASVVFTAFDMESLADLRNTPDFLPQWHQDCPKSDIHGYHGCLRYEGRLIPVYWASRQLDGKACVVDLKRAGTWSQLSPIEDPDDAQFRQGEFLIRVESFGHNEARLQQLIEKKPPLLDAHEDKRGYLLRRALITIRESFEYSLTDAKAGVQVLLRGQDENEVELPKLPDSKEKT